MGRLHKGVMEHELSDIFKIAPADGFHQGVFGLSVVENGESVIVRNACLPLTLLIGNP